MSNHEIQRIKEAYREYDRSKNAQTRRDSLNAGNVRIGQERARGMLRVLGARGLVPFADRRALEVGCGNGHVLASLMNLGAKPQNLYGIDLLPDRIQSCRKTHPGVHFACGNAEKLEFPDSEFDLVLVLTVFSSILDDHMADNVAAEVARVLRPGGTVLWYDFRYDNPWNPNVRGIGKRRVRELFPSFQVRLRSITLLPPLARHLGRLTPLLYPMLAAIPLLRTHYLGLLIKVK